MSKGSFVPVSGHPIIDLPIGAAIVSGALTFQYFGFIGIPVGLAVGAISLPIAVALEVYVDLAHLVGVSEPFNFLHH